MKSFAYGLQKAVEEFASSHQDSNLSRAVRDINIPQYFTEYCVETPKNIKETHENSQKVKRNQHSVNTRSKTTNETQPFIVSPSEGNNNVHQEDKHEKHQRINEFERLLRNFEEVTNALRSQLQNQPAPSSGPLKEHLKHEHQHQHAPNAAISLLNAEKPMNSSNLSQNKTKTDNILPKNEVFSPILNENSTNINLNSKNDTKDVRERHSHSHKKHKHLTKSKSKAKVEFPIDDENFSVGDDKYVSERLKQDKQMLKDEENAQELDKTVFKHPVKRSLEKNRGFAKKNKVFAEKKSKFGKLKKNKQIKQKSKRKSYKKSKQ